MRLLVAAVLVIWARDARAQYLSASGSPAPLSVVSAVAGTLPLPDIDLSTSYTVFSFGRGTQKITAQLNAPMPAGVTLTVTLDAPGTATSLGPVALGTTPRDVVTGIGFALATRTISYQLSATLAAGVVPRQTRTVTLTLTAAP